MTWSGFAGGLFATRPKGLDLSYLSAIDIDTLFCDFRGYFIPSDEEKKKEHVLQSRGTDEKRPTLVAPLASNLRRLSGLISILSDLDFHGFFPSLFDTSSVFIL